MQHENQSDKKLKELVVKVYDNKIFTSFQCKTEDIPMVFMPTMFIMSPPSQPSRPILKDGDNIRKKRKNKLDHLNDKMEWKKKKKHYKNVTLPEWEKNKKPLLEKFVNDIGMIYENLGKASPTGINGYPIFMSCKFLCKNDTKKFVNFYNKYKDQRELFDKEF